MKLFRIRSFQEYCRHSERISAINAEHEEFLAKNTPKKRKPFTIRGYSYPVGGEVDFLVDYQHAGDAGEILWRERVCCPQTGFNNRMRATFHLFDMEMEPYPDLNIYLTEQVTPVYRYFSERYNNVVGSEFLGDSLERGAVNSRGIRNEDLVSLTFPDEAFDAIVSLDVFEHIPEYESAFSECARVLKPGGRLMWSVPFVSSWAKNVIRSEIRGNEVVHLHPPEYHGDPLSRKGVLCFQHFGWEMLSQMLDAGFRDAYAVSYQSIEFGYLGGEQFVFFAAK